MTVNRYTGETEIRLAGQVYTLVFDFRALTEIAGIEEHLRFLIGIGPEAGLRAHLTGHIELLPRIVQAGLRARHGEVALEAIAAGLTPLRPALQATAAALWAAIAGPDEARRDGRPEGFPTATGGIWRRATRWWRRGAPLSSPA